MQWHFADLFESISARIPDRPALVHGDTRRTWREFEARSARLAGALAAAGLGPGAKIAIYGLNSNEFMEGHFAAFKLRAQPFNVNYRYVEHELLYLFDNADADAVIFDARFGSQLARIRHRLPRLRLLIEVDDGCGRRLADSQEYETLIATHAPLPRQDYAESDVYMFYTGGTTGMPKGVMYPHGDFTRGLAEAVLWPKVTASAEDLLALVDEHHANATAPVSLVACPLMHGTGLWLGGFAALAHGGSVVTSRAEHLDVGTVWECVERERVTSLCIVGDVFARPLLDALRAAAASGRPYRTDSLRQVISSGVMFSTEVKRGFLEYADVEIRDVMGSTEGSMGHSVVSRATPPGTTAVFASKPTTRVFNARDEEVMPGSDEVGMIANGGMVPIGYYKDPEKSARTFRVVAGKRYSFPGDFAKVGADGTLILLGRGSVCINSGGEKVFPEEVEEALKAHESVWDALVVGVPDPRFGERVTAVVCARPGHSIGDAALVEWARSRLAGYKVPRRIIVVEEVRRAPNGKADYKWAKTVALDDMAATGQVARTAN
jgi:fatty-acyl-CoA synthase